MKRRLIMAVVAVAAIGVLLLPVRPTVSEKSRLGLCRSNLREIASALELYREDHGHFPPPCICDKDGQPLWSWRVELLPYLQYPYAYMSLRKDEPWDSPYNRFMLRGEELARLFQCPSDPNHWRDDRRRSSPNYAMVVGPAREPTETNSGAAGTPAAGGTHDIFIVEVGSTGAAWPAPVDIDITSSTLVINEEGGQGVGSHHEEVVNALRLTREVVEIDKETSPTSLRDMLHATPCNCQPASLPGVDTNGGKP